VLLAQQSRAGVLALILGVALSVSIYIWSQAMNAVPLDIPMSLSVGHIRTPDFRTSVNIPYDIDIAFDSGIPLDELNCLTGMNLESVEPCTGQSSVLNVNWTLMSDGKNVASGSSTETVRAGYSYHKTARHIGSFRAENGRTYRLDLDVLQDAVRLGRANPRLQVEPFLNRYEGRLILAGIGFCLGILGAVVGVAMILISGIREKRLRKKLT
jgi:hypothetical protein